MSHPYETTAGLPTHADNFSQMNELLIRLEELAAMEAHLYNTESTPKDQLLAKGWLHVVKAIQLMRHNIIQMAQGRLQ